MAEPVELPQAPNGTAKLALGFAVVAVVVVAVAVVVVAMRKDASPSIAGGSARAPVVADGPEVIVVDARDVVRIDRGTVDPVSDRSGLIGIRINDPELLATLHLESTDVITAMSGRTVRRQIDVNDVLAGATISHASGLYVELVRAGKPVLVKWEIEGDLREARTGVSGGMSRLPPTPLAPDPLGDTIKRVTDFELELPRTTLWQIATNAQSGMSLGMRPVASISKGYIEGVKLYAIRPGSVWAALGFKSGDTLVSVNGRPIMLGTIADEFERLKNENTLEVSIVRYGKPVTLKYSITK
jgi:S1-C subfamily serine protease